MSDYEDLSAVQLKLVETIDDAFALKRWLGERREVLAFDTETGGLDWWRDPLRLVQLGDEQTGWAIPVTWLGFVIEVMAAYEGPIVAHNLKFDLHFLETNGVRLRRDLTHDTRIMAHLVNPARATGLKALARRLIHPNTILGERMLKDGMRENGWTWATVPYDFAPYWQYGALDPVLTARLYRRFAPTVRANYGWIYDIEIACQHVLADMERRGVRLDFGYIEPTLAAFDAYLTEMRAWIKLEFGVANPNSDPQVIDALQDRGMATYLTKRTDKGNVSVDAEVLRSVPDPLARAILAFRDADKVANTYLRNYVGLANGDLIHASINPIGARTGRMSVSRPSLQNIPRSEHPRNAFIARDGRRLVLSDYDQIEMRLLAHFAGEQRMIEAIRYGDWMTSQGYPGYDVHSMNARGIYGVSVDDPVPKKQRQVTKNSGFAKIYGAGTAQFARTAGITITEAETFLETYDRQYPGVTRFQSEVARVAMQRALQEDEPYVVAPSGRRHPTTKNKIYKLVNYLIQGTAADVLKRKLVELRMHGLDEYLVLPVHDEVIADVPKDDADEYAASLKAVMEDHESFAVPLTVDSEIVGCWGEKYRSE